MTDVCPACASPQPPDGAFCPVCGLPRPAADPVVGVTTEPELLGRTRAGVAASSAIATPVAGRAPTTERQYAGVGRRFAAYLLDGLAVSVPAWLLVVIGVVLAGVDLADPVALAAAVSGWTLGAGVLSLVLWVVVCCWEGATGAAVGGRLLGVLTVDEGTARPVGPGRALLRSLIVALGSVVPVVGTVLVLLSPLFDGSARVQGWHDKVANTVVLRGRPGSRATLLPAFPVGGPVGAPVVGAASGAGAAPDPWAFPAVSEGVAAAPDAVAAAPAAPAPTGLISGVPGKGVVPGPTAAPAPAAPVAPMRPSVVPATAVAPAGPAAPASSRDAVRATSASDGAFEDGWDETRLSAPAPADHVTRLAAPPVRPVALVLPDGTSVVVAGPTLVGRDPHAGGPGWALVPVQDPRRSVSKTHAELDVDGSGLWVTDRGSTNGTVVSEPGRPPRLVEPGARARVPLGAALHLGELRLGVREVGA